MDINTLKFDKNDLEQYIKDCFEILKCVEPYSDDYELFYDGAIDSKRVLATMAKEYLIENGYLEK